MTGPSDVERHTADLLARHRLGTRRPALPGPGEAWTCTCGIFHVSENAQAAHDAHVAAVLAAAGVLVAARPTAPEPDDREVVRERGRDEIVRLCQPGERWRMSVPANPTRDSDLILMAAIDAAPAEPVQDQRPAPEATPVLFSHDMYVVEAEWDRPTPDEPALPRLVGPFAFREEAEEWGRLNVVNGSWNVAPLAWPYFRSRNRPEATR